MLTNCYLCTVSAIKLLLENFCNDRLRWSVADWTGLGTQEECFLANERILGIDFHESCDDVSNNFGY